jgi:glycine/D-amino acid oxidase-like deaminating enzyme
MAANRAADVVIVGAGSVGAPAAMSLAEAGLKVLVLDHHPSVGQGSNKRAIGGLRATHSDPAKIRICLRSLEVFATWEERFGDKIEWHKGGYSYVAYRPEEERTLKGFSPSKGAASTSTGSTPAPSWASSPTSTPTGSSGGRSLLTMGTPLPC